MTFPGQRYDTPTAVLDFVLREWSKKLYTVMPGNVVSFDANTRRASVRGAIDVLTKDDRQLERVVIRDVPVVFPQGGGYSMRFPLAAGDPVLLLFSQIGIENWKKTHERSTPVLQRFQESDAICVPGFGPFIQPLLTGMDVREAGTYRPSNGGDDVALSAGDVFPKADGEHVSFSSVGAPGVDGLVIGSEGGARIEIGDSVTVRGDIELVGDPTGFGGISTAAEVSVDASGFNGNLATTDDDLQKVAQKVDDLSVGSGGLTEGQVDTRITTLRPNAFTDADESKLDGIADGAEVNVQANWTETDTASDAFIENKPTIPAAQVSSDWNATSGVAQILNKPTLAPSNAEANVNADWNADSGDAQILNKPTIPATAADISVVTTSFDGNLATTDDDLQKVAQKVDDLALGSGSVGEALPDASHTAIGGGASHSVPCGASNDTFGAWTEVWRYTHTDAETRKFLFTCYATVEANWTPTSGADRAGIRYRAYTRNGANAIQATHFTNLMGYVRNGNGSYANLTDNQSTVIPIVADLDQNDYVVIEAQAAAQVAGTGRALFFPTGESAVVRQEWTGRGPKGDKGDRGDAGAGEDNVQADWAVTDTASDAFIQNKPAVITSAERAKLGGIAAGAEVNVQADWSAASGDAAILNKPSIPAAQVQPDWDATTGLGSIRNKPTVYSATGAYPVDASGFDGNLTTSDDTVQKVARKLDDLDVSANGHTHPGQVFTSADESKLDGIADGAEVNVQANWTETDTASDAFIQNKPALAPSNAEANVQSDWNATSGDAQILNKPTVLSQSDVDTRVHAGVKDFAETGNNARAAKTDLPTDTVYTDTQRFTSALQTKLAGIADGAEVNVQADWTATSGDALILNKPTIPAAQVPADWDASTGVARILNKPTIPSNADIDSRADARALLRYTAAEKTKLGGIADGAEVNVQSDWNATSGDALILNKPAIPAAQIQIDWNAASGLGSILNKPTVYNAAGAYPIDASGFDGNLASTDDTVQKVAQKLDDYAPPAATVTEIANWTFPTEVSETVASWSQRLTRTSGGGAVSDLAYTLAVSDTDNPLHNPALAHDFGTNPREWRADQALARLIWKRFLSTGDTPVFPARFGDRYFFRTFNTGGDQIDQIEFAPTSDRLNVANVTGGASTGTAHTHPINADRNLGDANNIYLHGPLYVGRAKAVSIDARYRRDGSIFINLEGGATSIPAGTVIRFYRVRG